MKTYKIYLNRAKDEEGRSVGFWGYKPEHELELVYEWVTDEITREDIWEKFNRGAPGFIGDDLYPQRSLSVGDVVELHGTRWAVAGVGWQEVLNELNLITPVSEIMARGRELAAPHELLDQRPGLSPIEAALVEIAGHGFADEESGDVDAFIWFARIDRWILTQDELGFYDHEEHGTEDEAKARFAQLDAKYVQLDSRQEA